MFFLPINKTTIKHKSNRLSLTEEYKYYRLGQYYIIVGSFDMDQLATTAITQKHANVV